jgi:ADP-ribose pyrophosphatase
MAETDPENNELLETEIRTECVYSGALLHVRRDLVRLPDGRESVREFIRHPGASAVVPIHDNGDVVLLRQFRYAAGKAFIEVPAGKRDTGELPEDTAVRELREEAGLKAGNLDPIGHIYPGVGYSDEVIHLYTATVLSEVGTDADDDEFVQPFRIPFEDAVGMVHTGRIDDAKTMISLLRAWEWWMRGR